MQLKDYIGEATAYDKKLMLERKDPTSWLKSVSNYGRIINGVASSSISTERDTVAKTGTITKNIDGTISKNHSSGGVKQPKHHLKSAKMVRLSGMSVMALTAILSAKLSAKNPGRY